MYNQDEPKRVRISDLKFGAILKDIEGYYYVVVDVDGSWFEVKSLSRHTERSIYSKTEDFMDDLILIRGGLDL